MGFEHRDVWDLHPYFSVGPIDFSMKRDEVRERFGSNYRSFGVTSSQRLESDQFDSCISIYYSPDNSDIYGVSLSSPLRIIYRSVPLLGDGYEDTIENLKEIGLTPIDDQRVLFDELGGALGYVEHDSKCEPLQSVFLCSEHGYPEYRRRHLEVDERRRARSERRKSHPLSQEIIERTKKMFVDARRRQQDERTDLPE